MIFLILPLIVATTSFFFIFDPSFFLVLNIIFLSINLKVCLANSNPPIIPSWLEISLIFFVLLFKSSDVFKLLVYQCSAI